MNSYVQIILINLLLVTIVLSSTQATSQSVSSSPSASTPPQQLQKQTQHNAHRARKQHHHHHHHPHHHPQHPGRRLDNKENNAKRERLREAARHPDQDVELIGAATAGVTGTKQQNKANATTTRLRRITARDYYNRVTQRRLNNKKSAAGGLSDWSYNNYNIYTNTFGGPSVLGTAGKGDDNSHDVEFIGSSSNNANEWSAPFPTTTTTTTTTTPPTTVRRSYSYTPVASIPMIPASAPVVPRRGIYMPATSAPPPLVPVRRGYATSAPASHAADSETHHTTEDPFETNLIGRNYPSDPKDMEKRHICVQQRTVQMPVKTTEVYTRPIWKHISTPCQPQTHANQMCTRVQLVHEPAYRDVIRHKSAQQVTYDCCAGWMRETSNADACMKPICNTRCQNGGICSGPDTCTCTPGFTGRYCEHDINECKEEKPCDQTCINTVGSFYCKCREGFVLQGDQQSCKKTDLHEDDAFEARDLENEIESNDDLSARLHKIERSLVNERVQTKELEKSLQATYHVVDSLKSRLTTLEKQQQDVHRLQSNIYATESRTNKLESMLNMLMKCRNGPNAHCP